MSAKRKGREDRRPWSLRTSAVPLRWGIRGLQPDPHRQGICPDGRLPAPTIPWPFYVMGTTVAKAAATEEAGGRPAGTEAVFGPVPRYEHAGNGIEVSGEVIEADGADVTFDLIAAHGNQTRNATADAYRSRGARAGEYHLDSVTEVASARQVGRRRHPCVARRQFLKLAFWLCML